jgi:hypothetical protein
MAMADLDIQMNESDSAALVDYQDEEMGILTDENARTPISSLRINSLLLASFPWYTSLPMAPTYISDQMGEEHYGVVSKT